MSQVKSAKRKILCAFKFRCYHLFTGLVNRFEKLQKSTSFPKDIDLQGTVKGLIRLQQTYKLNTSDLANGQIKGYQS